MIITKQSMDLTWFESHVELDLELIWLNPINLASQTKT